MVKEKFKCASCGKYKPSFDMVAKCCLIHVNYDVQPPSIGKHGYKKGYLITQRPETHIKNDSTGLIRCDNVYCKRIIPNKWYMVQTGDLRFCIGCENYKATDPRIVGMLHKNPSREFNEFLTLAMDNPEFVDAFNKCKEVRDETV